MSDEFVDIEFKKIDTEDSAKKFAESIQENKTYFLDGKWGSGKTEFIENAKKHLTKKIIQVDLWRVSDNRSIVEIVYYRMHKCCYFIIKYGVFLLIALSILLSTEVNLGWTSRNLLFNNLAKIVTWTLTALVVCFQFFGRKSDDLFIFLQKINLKNKLLIFDDFDRVKPEIQEETYKIFNLLNGKLPILFVGDYAKLTKNEDKYLQKIIDQKYVLPYQLHSSHATNIDELPEFIKELFTQEERVLRELDHFIKTTNRELKDKFKRVQYDQQLLIIYVYLFYPEKYRALLIPEMREELIYIDDLLDDQVKLIDKVISGKLKHNDDIPKGFCSNPQAYMIYENATNLSVNELITIFESDEKLQLQLEQTNESDETYREVYYFIKCMNLDEWREHARRIEKIAIIQIKNRVSPNELTKYVFQQKMKLLNDVFQNGRRFLNVGNGYTNEFVEYANANNVNPRENVSEGIIDRKEVIKLEIPFIFKEIDNLFECEKIDVSQQIYFYHEFIDTYAKMRYDQGCLVRLTPKINDEIVVKKFSDIVNKLLEDDNYILQCFPEQILIAKIGFWQKDITDDKLKILRNKILNLSDVEFKYFWNFYDIKPYQDSNKFKLQDGELLSFDKEFYNMVLNRLTKIG